MTTTSLILRKPLRLFCLIVAFSIFATSASAAGLSKGTLVFVANPSGNWELFVLRAGDSVPEQLTRTALDERAPALSPDAKRVAYATSDGSLWVLTLETRQTTKLDLPPGAYGYPCWLPDGSGIVYTSYQYTPTGEDADLFVYRFQPASSRLFLMQTGPQDYASVSPLGDRVAYVASVATTIPGFGSTVTEQLWVASLRTGSASPLFRGSSHDTRPAWAKDGASIAFSSDRSGTTEIWLVDAEGHRPQQLSTGPGAKSNPTWSPNGSEIAYVSTASGRYGLEIINTKTKTARTLAIFESQQVDIRDPNWR
jgi:TolB protein